MWFDSHFVDVSERKLISGIQRDCLLFNDILVFIGIGSTVAVFAPTDVSDDLVGNELVRDEIQSLHLKFGVKFTIIDINTLYSIYINRALIPKPGVLH